ncbi:MAG: precorrin-2 dehydrogenase/sirohydrochlorin ferrochelatase family protein [Myxococcales bacterium]
MTPGSAPRLDYPVALRLDGKRVLLVGGGRIAEERARRLIECGVRLRLVAPAISANLATWAAEGKLQAVLRPFEPGDLDGVFVAFTATSSRAVNRAVVEAARARRILANAADAPDLCDFTLPAVARRGDLCIAITSGGTSPTAAKAARDRALEAIGPEFGVLTSLLGRLRPRLPAPTRALALQAIVDGGGARLLSQNDRAGLFGLVKRSWRAARAERP